MNDIKQTYSFLRKLKKMRITDFENAELGIKVHFEKESVPIEDLENKIKECIKKTKITEELEKTELFKRISARDIANKIFEKAGYSQDLTNEQ